ncbi:3-hydroxyisobutyrate dehydrogenase, mitochondrial-like [Vespa mandarinia]|uniref:3-hydroxyisobutyrate dehydrogenase, mitochondrial-like n=1 Tax=Vespa mandarinia TaxID=7446 RepID=UPI00161B1F49|nr:3-hydroxyisobutyrate dehydrogenase, mitochondrial-like [Vespa mandarinia]
MYFLVFISKSSIWINMKGVRQLSKKIGFVGLGKMGGHMAKNILKKGYKLKVFDVDKSAMSNLVEVGANAASTITETVKDVDVIISMLPSNQHVLDCYIGDNGILSSVRKNVLLIDSSTIDPFVSQELSKETEKREVKFIDAPVSGGTNAARDGTLTFMVGGSNANFEAAKSILEIMGSRIVHCGDVGMGQAAKLCNNMLLAISMIGTAEIFNLGQRLGLKENVLNEIVNSSSGRCWSSELYNPVPGLLPNVPSSKNYEGGFSTLLMAKDLSLAQSVATRTNTLIPLGSLAHQIYRMLNSHGLSQKDFSIVYQFIKGNKI